jgi:UDP-glucose 4-epimerase
MQGAEKKPYETFNLGTGTGRSVLELIQEFELVLGKPLPYTLSDRRQGDIEQIWANPSKANKELNWKADTPIREVLKSAWDWERQQIIVQYIDQ